MPSWFSFVSLNWNNLKKKQVLAPGWTDDYGVNTLSVTNKKSNWKNNGQKTLDSKWDNFYELLWTKSFMPAVRTVWIMKVIVPVRLSKSSSRSVSFYLKLISSHSRVLLLGKLPKMSQFLSLWDRIHLSSRLAVLF